MNKLAMAAACATLDNTTFAQSGVVASVLTADRKIGVAACAPASTLSKAPPAPFEQAGPCRGPRRGTGLYAGYRKNKRGRP
jgi:hypothetical protein